MAKKNIQIGWRMVIAIAFAAVSLAVIPPGAEAQGASQSAIAKQIGAVKAINGNSITLAPISGREVSVTVEPNARLLRIAPGEKDLKNAAPIQMQDLKVGDTVRVRGHATPTGIDALEVLVITSGAVDAAREEVRQDWQKRGIGGLVESVDAAGGTVTLSIPGLTGKKTVVVHTAPSTVVRRYSPESARPEDAKQVTLQDVQPGDQLRARGTRSTDGNEMTAEEIYAGVFPQFAGTIKAIDASAGTLSVQDLATKKTVQLKVTGDSQLHQVPAEMAQRMAGMLKMAKSGGMPGAAGNASGGAAAAGSASGANVAGGPPASGMRAGNAGGMPGGRAGGGMAAEFQRRLDQTPAVKLTDLHKGDAVAVLATQGTPSEGSTVIKMFSGVAPILQAVPSAGQAMVLTPWSLGGAPGGEAMQ